MVDDEDDDEREGVMGVAEGMIGVMAGDEGRPRSCAAWETDFSHFAREWRSRWSRVRTRLKSLSRRPMFTVVIFIHGCKGMYELDVVVVDDDGCDGMCGVGSVGYVVAIVCKSWGNGRLKLKSLLFPDWMFELSFEPCGNSVSTVYW